jgi:uncharacterized membrane protein AbrB (regulator of aidB expression)
MLKENGFSILIMGVVMLHLIVGFGWLMIRMRKTRK